MSDTLYTRRFRFSALFGGLAALTLLASCSDGGSTAPEPADTGASTPTETVPVDVDMVSGDIIQGNPESPVTVIEYASMTCSHCASFHKFTYPRLKENYIDTGKIQFVFREFPLDTYALEASLMARCGGKDRYFDIVHETFVRQEEWVLGRSPSTIRRKLMNIGADMGITEGMYETCQENEAIKKQIAAKAAQARTRYDVSGTPAIVINGKLFDQAPNYNNIARHIEDLLANNQ